MTQKKNSAALVMSAIRIPLLLTMGVLFCVAQTLSSA